LAVREAARHLPDLLHGEEHTADDADDTSIEQALPLRVEWQYVSSASQIKSDENGKL